MILQYVYKQYKVWESVVINMMSYQALARVQVTCQAMVVTLTEHTWLNQRPVLALHIELRYFLPVVTWSTFLQKTHASMYSVN